MTLHVKDGGTWKEVTGLYVKDGGTWKEATNAYVKDAGSWKEFKAPAGGGGGGYTYTVAASSLSGGKTIDGSFTLSPASGGTVAWTVTYASSSPPGFWSTNTSYTTGEPATIRSVSNDASSGTLVSLTYNVSATVNGDDSVVEPTQVTFLHQF